LSRVSAPERAPTTADSPAPPARARFRLTPTPAMGGMFAGLDLLASDFGRTSRWATASASLRDEPLLTAVGRDGGAERRPQGRFATNWALARLSARTICSCCTTAIESLSPAIGAPSPHLLGGVRGKTNDEARETHKRDTMLPDLRRSSTGRTYGAKRRRAARVHRANEGDLR
jgi:hypothetical protein